MGTLKYAPALGSLEAEQMLVPSIFLTDSPPWGQQSEGLGCATQHAPSSFLPLSATVQALTKTEQEVTWPQTCNFAFNQALVLCGQHCEPHSTSLIPHPILQEIFIRQEAGQEWVRIEQSLEPLTHSSLTPSLCHLLCASVAPQILHYKEVLTVPVLHESPEYLADPCPRIRILCRKTQEQAWWHC